MVFGDVNVERKDEPNYEVYMKQQKSHCTVKYS